jgi:hypothetical protein
MQSKDFYCASNKLENIKCKFQCLDCKGYGEKYKSNSLNMCEHSECCCKCVSQMQINKHPKNKGESKGSIRDLYGFVCLNKFGDKSGSPTFSEDKHGSCEMFCVKK